MTKIFQCGCGEWTGERCEWTGETENMLVVEYMPEYLRASHEAAGNSGCYPLNGAIRVAVERSCGERAVGEDGAWASIVEYADPAEYAECSGEG